MTQSKNESKNASKTELKKRATQHPRGYLLLETMASGAIIAVILASSMSVVAAERAATSRATLRARASSLAEVQLQALQADFGVTKQYTCPSTGTALTINATDYPGFSGDWDCNQNGTAAVTDYGNLYELIVNVNYPNNDGGDDTVTHHAIRRDRHAI
jgi:type II secretory pathway pseudopilin PulG